MNIPEIYELFLKSSGVCTDTRHIKKNELFFAMKGPSFNGNEFAAAAIKNGALAAVIDEEKYAGQNNIILVDDALKTLQQLAVYHRQQLKIPVIAIAGSNGKTTTKELLFKVLSEKYNAFATPGNLNNHIGVPLSLLKIKKENTIAIIELGANHLYENAELCYIALPDYGIVTNVGKDHLEGFGSIAGVKAANKELYDHLKNNKGIAFVNASDDELQTLAKDVIKIFYARGDLNGYFCSGSIIEKFPVLKVIINFSDKNELIEINSQLFGSFHLYNILAAACIGKYFGVEPQQIKHAVENYIPANNRSQIIMRGTNKIILDAYNANPSSVEAGVKDFGEMPGDNKIIILADMHELGDESFKEHLNIINLLKKYNFEKIILVGNKYAEHKPKLNCFYFADVNELKHWYTSQTFNNKVFYIKGSRSEKLEKMLE